MPLATYLNENFPSSDGIEEHFMEKFGVKVKQENDLFLFQYDMLAAKWLEPITHVCRGTILRLSGGSWEVLSRPFDKFFNQGEGHCKLFETSAFEAAIGSLAFIEKADGTCIQVWFDDIKEEWRISTLGTITTWYAGDSNLTFDQLFFHVLGKGELEIPNELRGHTLLFELCSIENRIVTQYEKDTIFLLAIRNIKTGDYVDREQLKGVADTLGVRVPAQEKLTSLGIQTLKEAVAYVEKESEKHEKYGNYPEGMVIYKEGVPVCKMKNERYVQLHHAVGAGDLLCTRNKIIEAYFSGNIDDLMPVLIPTMVKFAETVRSWWASQLAKLLPIVAELAADEYETQKDYALKVQAIVPKQYMGFFFVNKEKILAHEIDSDSFAAWMKQNSRKFEKEIKELYRPANSETPNNK